MPISDRGNGKDSGLECPACGSTVNYRYGWVKTGKRRLRCVLCGRQFIVGARRVKVNDRPFCKICGKPMHLYKRERRKVRFRCSGYPECRTYEKVDRGDEVNKTVDQVQIPA